MPRMTTAALAAALTLAAAPPVHAQQQGGGVSVGTLRCDVAGSAGFVFGSTRELACRLTRLDGSVEGYRGEISRYGVDLGFTSGGVLVWGVLAPTTDLQPGALAGTFVGASSGVAAGVGVGTNLLVGGGNRSIQLQPLSVEGTTGLNIALGVAEMELRPAP